MSSRFRIDLMCEKDRNNVLNLLLNSFFEEEPLAKHLQLNKPIQFAENLFNDALKDQCSFVVYDIQTNELIGISLNEIQTENNNEEIINHTNEKIYFILHFLNSMHSNINLFHQFQTNSLLHIFIINIEKKSRGYGLGSQLISASIEQAKKMNIKGVYAEATSIYSFNSFQRQGFEVYHQVNYKDYDPIRLANLNDQCQLVARLV